MKSESSNQDQDLQCKWDVIISDAIPIHRNWIDHVEKNLNMRYEIGIKQAQIQFFKTKSQQKDKQIKLLKEAIKRKTAQTHEQTIIIKENKRIIRAINQKYKTIYANYECIRAQQNQLRSKRLNILQQKNNLHEQYSLMETSYRKLIHYFDQSMESPSQNNTLLPETTQDIDIQIYKLKNINNNLTKEVLKASKSLDEVKKQTESQDRITIELKAKVKELNDKINKLEEDENILNNDLEESKRQEKLKESAKKTIQQNNEKIRSMCERLDTLRQELQKKNSHIESYQQNYKLITVEEHSLRKELLVEKQLNEVHQKYKMEKQFSEVHQKYKTRLHKPINIIESEADEDKKSIFNQNEHIQQTQKDQNYHEQQLNHPNSEQIWANRLTSTTNQFALKHLLDRYDRVKNKNSLS